MLNKNAVIILKCIMDRDKCDMGSAIWFVKHNQMRAVVKDQSQGYSV